MFALDSLMCQVENDLEDLVPEKRMKAASSSSESEEESQSDASESSAESD